MLISVFSILTDICLPESNPTTTRTNIRETSLPAQTDNTTTNSPSPNAPPTATSTPNSSSGSPAPALGLLTIKWTNKCGGEVYLILYHPSNSSSPVCRSSETYVDSLLRNVCEKRKGCEDTQRWNKGRDAPNGYYISESGAQPSTSCDTLRVQCKGWSVVVCLFKRRT